MSYNLGETNINTIENKKDKNWFTYKYQEYPYELYFVDLNMHVNKKFSKLQIQELIVSAHSSSTFLYKLDAERKRKISL